MRKDQIRHIWGVADTYTQEVTSIERNTKEFLDASVNMVRMVKGAPKGINVPVGAKRMNNGLEEKTRKSKRAPRTGVAARRGGTRRKWRGEYFPRRIKTQRCSRRKRVRIPT